MIAARIKPGLKLPFRPATWPWLLMHELRLTWRGTGGAHAWLGALFGGILWLGIHFAAYGLLPALHGARLPAMTVAIGGLATWFMLTLMLSTAMALSVRVLFERGDFDLLLASPLPVATVFIVRGLGIALTTILLWAVLLTPFAHAGLVRGHAELLAIYPALFSFGLVAASIGMAMTVGLVRWIGARRARTVAQLIGALTGAVVFLASQLQNMLPGASRSALVQSFTHALQPGGALASDSAAWLPLRALTGEPLPLLIVCGVGAFAFLAVISGTRRRFVAGLQEAAAVSAPAKRRLPGRAAFRGGLASIVIRKELTLIVRDPQLIAQTLLQVLYLLPLVFVAARGKGLSGAVVPGAVLMGSALAGALCWLTVAAEEAPELIGSAPVSITRIRWLKIAAALLPAWLLMLPLFGWYLMNDLRSFAVLLVCFAGSSVSAGVVQVWYPRAGNRRDLKHRYKENRLQNFIEGVSTFGWAGAAFGLLTLPWALVIALPVALMGPATAWFMGRSRGLDGDLAATR